MAAITISAFPFSPIFLPLCSTPFQARCFIKDVDNPLSAHDEPGHMKKAIVTWNCVDTTKRYMSAIPMVSSFNVHNDAHANNHLGACRMVQ